MLDLFTESDATISDCGNFRYRLERRWGGGSDCVFVMLNPSTADASEDDPTVRRCIGFARREGCGSLTVVNLFSLRSTDPAALLTHGIKNGPESNRHIREAVEAARGPVICAWGAHKATVGRDSTVLDLIRSAGHTPLCLGRTKAGAPRHPLYLRSNAPLTEFSIH